MNERQFQAWLVDRAPASAPASLHDRVLGIPADGALHDPRRRAAGTVRSLAHSKGRRRALALGLVAAVLTGSVIAAGVWLDRQDDPPLPANGRIVVAVGAGAEVVVVDPASGTTVPLSAAEADGRPIDASALQGATSLAWSPDGRSIAYTTPSRLGILDIGTGAQRQITGLDACGEFAPCGVAWSPDGETIAFTNGASLGLADVSSAAVTTIATIPGDLTSPSWAPDGRSIAFARRKELFVVRRDGSSLTQLLSEGEDRMGPVDVHWSPDGKRIGFLSSDAWHDIGGWALQVVVVDPDGSDRRVIADAGSCFCLGWWPPGFTWSPDGTQIAFVTLGFDPGGRVHDPHVPVAGGLYVAGLDGSGRRLLYPSLKGSPAWQPVP